MNLKLKVLSIVALIFTIISIIYVTLQIKGYNQDIQWAIAREEQSLDSTISLLEQHQLDHFVHRLNSIVQNDSIISALAQQKRKQLYHLTLPLFLDFKLENNTELNIHFHLPDGNSFLRMHNPEKHGDNLLKIRPVIREVHNKKVSLSAYEIGRSGCYYRIIEPLFHEDIYIGAVEIGIPVSTFAKAIDEQLQIKTFLFFETDRWKKVSYKEFDIQIVGNYSVVHEECKNCCLLPPYTELANDTHTRTSHNDKVVIAHSLPIFKDYQGEIIGGLLACQNITPFIERKKHFIRSTITLMVVLFLSFMGIMYFTIGRLMDNLETYRQKQNNLLNSLELEIVEHKRSKKERNSLQAQLLQSQKMEALGLLSSGIAHDFNNLLTSIMGYTQLILTDKGLNNTIKNRLHEISSAGEKAADLIRQLLAFSRKQPIVMKPINLALIVYDLSKMITRLIGEDIELIINVEKDESLILGDKTQIEQIMINLAVNARDAMPRGGLLTVTSKKITLEEEIHCIFSDILPGTYVLLTASDTGFGIDPEDIERIFEPFFTTKDEGKGTGLGLSTVFGIVSQHNGHICVKSEIGKGTTFMIFFPAISRRKDDTEQRSKSFELSRGNETILVVEDEIPIQDVLKEILDSLGYHVHIAQNSREAALIFEKNKDAIQLVLADIVLPDTNGHELFLQLSEKKPGLKVVYMSGHSVEILLKYGVDLNKVQFLQKPLSISNVATAIRKSIDYG